MELKSFQKWEKRNNPDISIITLGLEGRSWRVERKFKNSDSQEDFFRPMEITKKFKFVEEMPRDYEPEIFFSDQESAQQKAQELCAYMEAEKLKAYKEARQARPIGQKLWDWIRGK